MEKRKRQFILLYEEEELKEIIRDSVFEAISRMPQCGEDAQNQNFGSIDLAVSITGYAKSTIYNLVNSSKLPHIKKNGRLFFSRTDLIAYLESGRQKVNDTSDITDFLK